MKLGFCCNTPQTKTQTLGALFSFIMSINFSLNLQTNIHRKKFWKVSKVYECHEHLQRIHDWINLEPSWQYISLSLSLSLFIKTMQNELPGNCFCQDTSNILKGQNKKYEIADVALFLTTKLINLNLRPKNRDSFKIFSSTIVKIGKDERERWVLREERREEGC